MLVAVEGRHTAVSAVYGRRFASVCDVEVDSACAAACGLFRSQRAALRIVRTVLLGRVLENVVVSCDVGRDEDVRSAA